MNGSQALKGCLPKDFLSVPLALLGLPPDYIYGLNGCLSGERKGVSFNACVCDSDLCNGDQKNKPHLCNGIQKMNMPQLVLFYGTIVFHFFYQFE